MGLTIKSHDMAELPSRKATADLQALAAIPMAATAIDAYGTRRITLAIEAVRVRLAFATSTAPTRFTSMHLGSGSRVK